ncbi:MAG TPA: hypothetical protein VF331_15365 [Polyangiales bacterium]
MDPASAEPMHSQGPDGVRWCAGLPGTQKRPMSEAQRELVLVVYRKARDTALGYGVVAALLLPASIGLGVLLGRLLGAQSWWPSAVAMLLFCFGIPVCIAKAIDGARSALPLRRDLEREQLWIFEGTLASAAYEDEDPDVVALVEKGQLERGGSLQCLGVLPNSERLVHVNGRDVEPRRRMHVATTATSPERSVRYSLPPDVKQAFGASFGLKRRRFGDAERRELSAHIARLTSVPWTLFVLTGFMAITISLWMHKGVDHSRDFLGIGWLVAWLMTALRHVRRYLLARRFEDDLEVGWLLSWETPAAQVAMGPQASPPFRTAEVLPISQMDWMIDGKPAAWRRVLQTARGAGR